MSPFQSPSWRSAQPPSHSPNGFPTSSQGDKRPALVSNQRFSGPNQSVRQQQPISSFPNPRFSGSSQIPGKRVSSLESSTPRVTTPSRLSSSSGNYPSQPECDDSKTAERSQVSLNQAPRQSRPVASGNAQPSLSQLSGFYQARQSVSRTGLQNL